MDNKYLAEKIQEHKGKVKKSKWAVWSWVALAAAVIGYFIYLQLSTVGDRKLLAKLKHQRDLHEEEQRQAVAAVEVEKLATKKAELRQQIVDRHARSAKIDEDIKLREAQKVEVHERISKLKDWDDIDSNVVFRSKSDGN